MTKFVFAFYAVLFSALLMAEPIKVVTSITPEATVVQPGTKVEFSGKITAGDNLPGDAKVFYEEYVNGIIKRKGNVVVGEEIALQYQLGDSGWYMVQLKLVDADNKPVKINGKNIVGGRGVFVTPEKLPASAPRPADFDEFWDSRRALLNAVPVKELERRELGNDKQSATVAYDVKVACAGSKPLTGVLTMPRNAAPRSLSAIVFFQGAGVATAHAIGGYGPSTMVFMVNAHGIENMREQSYYKEFERGALRGYAHFDKNDREKTYFHDMFLRVMRSMDYVKSLPQWNGRVLIARGGSQGGAQAVVAAAMDPQVTLLTAFVPAMCDHNGFMAKPARRCGWPGFYNFTADNKDVVKTASYYDMVNFASRVRCETFISTGLTDLVCPPPGVACLFNAIAAEKKQFLIHPTGDHAGPQLDKKFMEPINNRIAEHLKE